ncbi:MAG TPA: hypothetical protein VMF08_18660 [Candidatus Sulfotelmatobacter sp.]|nr:hypothetical protein [Candidatus Sulfotelmatobacter sp.]
MKTVKPNPMPDDTTRIEREQLMAVASAEIEKIQVICSYSSSPYEHAGIGYRDSKLVEFTADDSGFTINKITLLESVEWFEKMDFCERRLGLSIGGDDSGFGKWLGELATALKTSSTVAKN